MKEKQSKKLILNDELTEFLLYTAPNGKIKVEAFLHNESLWLTQKRMAELFGIDRTVITKHLKNIFESGELNEKVVCAKIAHTTQHGAIRGKTQVNAVQYYNLDAILSVGYRVNSLKATQFRIWASKVLKDYIIKGFAMDDDRLKNGRYFGKDYFRELLERVRSIRTSERRIYLQITDIFAECSLDYDKNSETARTFFATVQNKFHFAITGKTAAEKIYATADHKKPCMGMLSWKNSPKGRILKSDVSVGLNYLTENEIKELESLVASYFDYIERMIKKRTTFTMESLAKSLTKFLEFNEYQILASSGKISTIKAKTKAEKEYDVFNKTQKINSDFEQHIKKLAEQK